MGFPGWELLTKEHRTGDHKLSSNPIVIFSLLFPDAGTAGKESKACEEISNLVNYITPVRFKSFDHASKRERAFEMSSFDEKFATSLLKSDSTGFVKYNKFQTSRIYPKGTRYGH